MLSALTVALSLDHQFCRQIDAYIKLQFTEKKYAFENRVLKNKIKRCFHINYCHIQQY